MNSEIAPFTLSAEAIAAYHRDGFVGPIPMLDAARVDELRAAIDEVMADLAALEPKLYEVEQAYRERPREVVCHFLGGWLVHPALRRVVFDLAVTVPAAMALGVTRLRFWHDQVFAKPPRHAGVVPWHQDESYWLRTTPIRHITVNLMLDDADETNGCLQFVPGSHRGRLLPKLPFDSPLEALRESLHADELSAFRPRAVSVPAGHATLHHPRTLHGSGANRSDRPRRAIVLNYMAPDTKVADDSAPLLRGVDRLPKGAIIEGRHFPIVVDLGVEVALLSASSI